MDDRIQQILSLIPSDVKTILDVGSENNIFINYKTTRIDLTGAEINQDLNKNQKLKIKSNSFDLVVLSQILEHLGDVTQIIEESKRVSKKYILVGLPNEVTLDNRFRILIGKPGWEGYLPYWHKHYFTVRSIERFINQFFENYKEKNYLFGVSGGRFIPLKTRKWLSKTFPKFFAKEIYYLIELKK